MNRLVATFLAALTAAAQPVAAAEAPKVQLPAQIAGHVPGDLRSYFVVFLVDPAVKKDMPHDLFVKHQAYIREQVGNGNILLVGPFTDNGRIRGMKIVSSANIEEARRLGEGDPAVQASIFDVEVHPAVFPNLAGLKIAYAPRPE